MKNEDRPYLKEGTFVIPAGTRFERAEKGSVSLARPVELEFIDWDGASAGIYMEDPLSGRTINYGPNLGRHIGENDLEDTAFQVVGSMAKRYQTLRSQPELKDPDARDMETLKPYFSNAA